MQIRKVQPSDNKTLATIIRNIFIELDIPTKGTVYTDPTTDDLYNLFETLDAVLWVALEGDIVLGCCGVYPTNALPEGCVELVKFYLAPEARGKKTGKTLFEKSLESALELGYKSVYIESFPQFADAVKMYKKFGFKYLTNPLGNSGHFGCNIWMLKQI
jgi:putative acetyltransferase